MIPFNVKLGLFTWITPFLSGIDATEENPNKYKFSYNTKLKKGKNIISISINDEYEKQIVVNYK